MVSRVVGLGLAATLGQGVSWGTVADTEWHLVVAVHLDCGTSPPVPAQCSFPGAVEHHWKVA